MPEIAELLDRIDELYQVCLELSSQMKIQGKRGPKVRVNFLKRLKSIERILSVAYKSISEYKDPTLEKHLHKMKKNVDEITYLIDTKRKIREKYREILNERGITIKDQRGIVNCLEKGYYASVHWLNCCLANPIYDFIENARYIIDTRIFPETMRIETRGMLDELGFTEVIEILSEVDQNLIQGHFKDCLDNCRKALMRVVEHLVLEIEEKPKASFEGNMNILVEQGVIDQLEKRDFSTFFSILSQKSQHEMIGTETPLSPSDCNYLIDMTYARLKRILLKFKDFQS